MTTGEKFEKVADAVYDKGRTDEWSDFWDALQNNGNRVNYDYVFYSAISQPVWTDETLRPKHSMQPTTANRAFRYSRITSLKALFDDRGIELDFSKSTHCGFLFANSSVTEVGTIDLSSVTAVDNSTGIFSYCQRLERVALFRPSPNFTAGYGNAFAYCEKLKHITIEGSLIKTVSFSSSPLTVESMKSIITHLANYAGTENEGTQRLTFSETCWEELEASGKPFDDGLTTDETMTWEDYVGSLGWLT